jgi:acetyl esterase/lipase
VLSPVIASDNILKKYPPTRIIACEVDSMRDHSYDLVYKLRKSNVDARLILMKDYIHGFNSFDIKRIGIDEFKNGTSKTI